MSSIRHSIIKHIKDLWQDCEVKIFGSFVTGLSLPDSDVNIAVMTKEPGNTKTLIRQLFQHLKDKNALIESEEIFNIRIPLLKIVEKKTEIHISIYFNFHEGCDSIEVVMYALQEYPQLIPLLLSIKAYLRERGLNESSKGGMGSFPLMMAIIGYLQYQNKLTNGKLEDMSLGELFIEFFEFFGSKFNHEELGISIIGKGSFYRRQSNARGISIENPINPIVDLGASIKIYNDVVKSYQYAYDLLRYNAGSLTELIHSYPGRKKMKQS